MKTAILAATIFVLGVGGLVVAVLLGASFLDATRVSTFIAFGLIALLCLGSLITGRQPPWGRSEPHARQLAVAFVLLAAPSSIGLLNFGRGRVLAVLILALQLVLTGLSLLLIFSVTNRMEASRNHS